MTTFTVNTTADVVDGNYSQGQLSLREAVQQANATTATDTIEFAPAIEGKTLTLTGGELTVSEDLHIEGEGVTLEGNGYHRFLNISRNATTFTGTSVTVDSLTLAKGGLDIEVYGEYGKGGGIFLGSGNDLAMTNCTIRDCDLSRYGAGGGIFASDYSKLTLTSCAITGNMSGGYGYGGGIEGGKNVTLVIRSSEISNNDGFYGTGGIGLHQGSTLVIEDSAVIENNGGYESGAGGIFIAGTNATILRSTISNNTVQYTGGGIFARDSHLVIADSTIAGNLVGYGNRLGGGGLYVGNSTLVMRNSTMTGNRVFDNGQGGGISAYQSELDIANSIVAGNSVERDFGEGPDIFGSITLSNGHNIFGSDVLGNNPADRENIAASAIFANIDPETGGGQLNAVGIVPLLNNINNPALSGADRLAAGATGQTGDNSRPQPSGSLPDIGSIEINQPLSTTASARNDVLTGTAAANTINAVAGNDFLKGLGGKDTLNGGDGSDLLDGGTANDKLNGGGGIDLVFFGGATKVTFDLAATTDTAKRGSETDTLTSIEGAIGSSAGDTFKGDANNNWFQGGLGKDTFSGGSGRDLYDFNAVAESGTTATTRDVIIDFDHLVDDIDLMGIDADTTIARDQAFHWVGTAGLTAPGELGFFTSGGNTIIHGSNDADAADEFQIQLNGMKTLTVDDFYF